MSEASCVVCGLAERTKHRGSFGDESERTGYKNVDEVYLAEVATRVFQALTRSKGEREEWEKGFPTWANLRRRRSEAPPLWGSISVIADGRSLGGDVDDDK